MPDSGQQYENNLERISSTELIAGYLRRLKDAHTLLKVTIPKHAEICNTILVIINENENFIILDKLHPESGHNAFMQKKRCAIEAQHQGVSMGFTAQLEKLIDHDESPAYRISFPKEMLYHQKRSAFRAPIGVSNEIKVMLTREDDSEYAGTLCNISTGGFCVSLRKQTAEKLKVGEVFDTCRFTTSTGISIESAAEVRNIKIDDNKKAYRAGMRFVEISPQELRAVQRFVLTLERQQIKRSR
jgi:c-di-GMP-binding flagellar brake protein YcgR